MPSPSTPTIDLHRIACSRPTANALKKLFPTASYEEAIKYLISRYEAGAGDHANCGNTELWIKLDRLEEVLSLLALSNVDVADVYRRQVGAELGRLAAIAVRAAGPETPDSGKVEGRGRG